MLWEVAIVPMNLPRASKRPICVRSLNANSESSASPRMPRHPTKTTSLTGAGPRTIIPVTLCALFMNDGIMP